MEQYDIARWVEDCEPNEKEFRQAVHTVLVAIANEEQLRASMIIKGGILLAVRYHSHRFTKDIDFSTSLKLRDLSPEEVGERLQGSLSITVENLPYELDCRVQRVSLEPPEEKDPTYPNIAIKVGYALKGSSKHKRLLRKQSPTALSIDFSLNESTPNIETLTIDDGAFVQAYSFTDLMAEKFRSILQQALRERNRRQDVFDLYLLIENAGEIDEVEKAKILKSLMEKAESRGITPSVESMKSQELYQRAAKEYPTLVDEIEGDLPDFDEIFTIVKDFYESLPWG